MFRYAAAAVLGGFLLGGCSGPSQSGGGGGGGQMGGEPEQQAMTAEQLEEVKLVVRNGLDSVNSCYTSELEKRKGDKTFAGRVEVRILIGTNAAAEQVEIGESTLKAPEVHACIQQAIRSWEFPRIASPTWYPTPFEFSPAY